MMSKWNIAFGHITLFMLYLICTVFALKGDAALLLFATFVIYFISGFWTGITSVDEQKFAFFPAFVFWTAVKVVELIYLEITFAKLGVLSARYHIGGGSETHLNVIGWIYLVQYILIIALFFIGYFGTRGIRRNIRVSRQEMDEYNKRVQVK